MDDIEKAVNILAQIAVIAWTAVQLWDRFHGK